MFDCMSDYILFAETDINPEKKKEYKYYRTSDLKPNIHKQEISLDVIIKDIIKKEMKTDGQYGFYKFYDDYNHAKYTIEKIKDDVYSCPYALDYIEFNKIARDIIENKSEDYTEEEIANLKRGIGYRKRNSIEIDKDIITVVKEFKKYIYFKKPLRESEVIEYDAFNLEDKEQLLALLKENRPIDFNDSVSCLVFDLNYLINKTDFTEMEWNILKEYREKDSTQESMANAFMVTQQYISNSLDIICDKIINTYWAEMEDWYYTFVVKGKYKTCSKCKKAKIANERNFYKQTDSKDGLRSICIECMKN